MYHVGSSLHTLLKNTWTAVSAHVSPPPPGLGLVGLETSRAINTKQEAITEQCSLTTEIRDIPACRILGKIPGKCRVQNRWWMF